MIKKIARLSSPMFAILIVGFSVALLLPNAEARPIDFGISISNTCYRMHEYNISSNCPTYESIMAVFPDTSDQTRSGKFIIKDNQLQRGKPQMINDHAYYTFVNKTILFIDPGVPLQQEIKMIRIESRLPVYPMSNEVHNNTREYGELRHIKDCRVATIDASSWLWLLGDTLEFMAKNCDPDFRTFNETKYIKPKLFEHDIRTSNKWLHDQFLEFVKENCLRVFSIC